MNYIFYEIICIALHSIQVPNFRTQELFNPLAGENSPEMWKKSVEMWKKSVRNVEEIQTHHRIPPSCQWLLHWDSALSLKISFSRNIKIQNIKNLKKNITKSYIYIHFTSQELRTLSHLSHLYWKVTMNVKELLSVFLKVRSCLLINLIKCFKGQNGAPVKRRVLYSLWWFSKEWVTVKWHSKK